MRWGAALQPPPPPPPPKAKAQPKPQVRLKPPPKITTLQPRPVRRRPTPEDSCPATREPLSVENAVLQRDLPVLRREAADALAALGCAHALVTSARLAQVQEVRNLVEQGELEGKALMALVADYQSWQNDQVRLFDALALVLRTKVPGGTTLDQVDPGLHEQARRHLESLSVEYQKRRLMEQFSQR